MSDPVTTAIEIAKAGAQLLGVVIKLIDDAMNGDDEAISKLKRVEQILSPTSPTESAFKRAADIAAGKPSRDDEPTRETDT
jgi:hypothetical protein